MDFMRKILNSDELEKGIDVPDEFKHRQVELIIFPIDSIELNENFDNDTIKNLCGSLKGSSFNINKYLQQKEEDIKFEQ